MLAAKDELFTRPSGGYSIARSVRTRASASAYFNRTLGTATNQKIWTWSGWVKKSGFATNQPLLVGYSATTDTGYANLGFYQDTLQLGLWTNLALNTPQVFRDPSAWYHIVVATDLTQATATNRIKVYVNGSQVTYTQGAVFPAQNGTIAINSSVAHNIASRSAYASDQFFDGYLTEINFIDGQQLTPSSFGTTNAITGVWQPAKYTGTYGTNGFYLNFSDNSNNTATTIGKDYSGNGNNWTPNNISVTAGSTYDSMVDSPTVGATSSNYCVMNPITPSASLSYANLRQNTASPIIFGTFGQSTGKWYWEVTLTTQSTAALKVGIANSTATGELGDTSTGWGYIIQSNGNNGQGVHSGSATSTYSTFAAGDILNVAVDIDGGKIWWGKNGTYVNSGVPASGTGALYTDVSGTIFPAASNIDKGGGAGVLDWNFGQRPFSYTPPTGFVALNTYNLPASTITNGAAYMAATLYNGTGSSQSITNTVNNTSFQPDFFWAKARSTANAHTLIDSVRGSTTFLSSNNTDADTTSSDGTLSSFNSNGVTLQADTTGRANYSGRTYIGWQWKAGGTAVSNTNGSITSTVSVGATQGFSVVTYTGTGANATVGHGLGVAPSMIIIKARSLSTEDWAVYHTSIGNTYTLYLDRTLAQDGPNSAWWNNTSPTSSVFSLGGANFNNKLSATYVAYCFSAVAGYSAFGSYTGNGSADGPFVFTNFRPRWVMIKRTDSANDWFIIDTSRNTYNVAGTALYPNSSSSETSNGFYDLDVVSNGFKVKATNAVTNASGGTYIYAAFAESPFKTSLAR